jgi:quercetin dioxygenase-like cupin family protein
MKSTCKTLAGMAAFLICFTAAGAACAQAAGGIKRTVITRGDVSVPNREAVVAHVELAPGATAGRHTHPGDEITYFLDGEGELLIDGAPPRRVKAGEAIIIPAGVVHDARNPGNTTTKLVGVYVVEKGQPLATPVK